MSITKADQTKNIVRDLPKFTEEEMVLVLKDLANYFKEHQEHSRFMLLSNNINYFTIFERQSKIKTNKGEAQTIINFLTQDSFLTTLGDLKVLKRTGESEIEIWIGETPFVLFIADTLFVEL